MHLKTTVPCALAALLALAVATAPAAAGLASPSAASTARSAGPAAGRVPLLRPPLRGPVVRGFEPPAGPYDAGHRGIDLGAPPGSPVGAPAAGRVVFAGRVAGAGWVSVEIAPGVVVTLGPLALASATRGRTVAALDPLGRLAPGHGAGPHSGLHLGLRVDGAYVDPLPYLLGRLPPRLAALGAPGGR